MVIYCLIAGKPPIFNLIVIMNNKAEASIKIALTKYRYTSFQFSLLFDLVTKMLT